MRNWSLGLGEDGEYRYMMTWNGTNPSHADLSAVRIFDLFTGECKRTMPLPELAAVAVMI